MRTAGKPEDCKKASHAVRGENCTIPVPLTYDVEQELTRYASAELACLLAVNTHGLHPCEGLENFGVHN